MWALLLPLPWLLVGIVAAGWRRRGQPGCLFIGGVFIWPQAQLLQTLGISTALAWLISLALMLILPILGYVLGLRLFRSPDRDQPPDAPQ